MKQIQVSAVVPFLNEEKQVATVVNQLLLHPLIDEIICVNDGSTDRSVESLWKFRNNITLIELNRNYGKGYALARGIEQAKGTIVAFFDSDLVDFTNEHIDTLLSPVLEGSSRAVLGYPTGGYFFPFLFKSVTGERAYYRKDLLPHLTHLEKTNRFSTEYYLNSIFLQDELKKVPLKKLNHLLKYEKYKPLPAAKEILKDVIAITNHSLKKMPFL